MKKKTKADGGSICGGVVSKSLFDSDPWAYMMSYYMDDKHFKEYVVAKKDGRKFMLEYADKLFKKWGRSAI